MGQQVVYQIRQLKGNSSVRPRLAAVQAVSLGIGTRWFVSSSHRRFDVEFLGGVPRESDTSPGS